MAWRVPYIFIFEAYNEDIAQNIFRPEAPIESSEGLLAVIIEESV